MHYGRGNCLPKNVHIRNTKVCRSGEISTEVQKCREQNLNEPFRTELNIFFWGGGGSDEKLKLRSAHTDPKLDGCSTASWVCVWGHRLPIPGITQRQERELVIYYSINKGLHVINICPFDFDNAWIRLPHLIAETPQLLFLLITCCFNLFM